MDLKDLITVIPQILLYYVPGYVSLRIKERYYPEKRRDDYNSTAQSIIYSFIIGILYHVISYISLKIFKVSYSAFSNERFQQFMHLLLAVIFGLFLVLFPRCRIGKGILKVFNKSIDSAPNVWIKALQNENGAWATVYLRNGLVYIGKLRYFTIDPDDEQKQILLYSYRLCVRNEKETSPEGFCEDIKDTTLDPNSKVLLKYDDIVSIEIEKGTNPKD